MWFKAMSRNALQNPVMREQIEYRKYYVTKWLHNLVLQEMKEWNIDYRMSAEYVIVWNCLLQ